MSDDSLSSWRQFFFASHVRRFRGGYVILVACRYDDTPLIVRGNVTTTFVPLPASDFSACGSSGGCADYDHSGHDFSSGHLDDEAGRNDTSHDAKTVN